MRYATTRSGGGCAFSASVGHDIARASTYENEATGSMCFEIALQGGECVAGVVAGVTLMLAPGVHLLNHAPDNLESLGGQGGHLAGHRSGKPY